MTTSVSPSPISAIAGVKQRNPRRRSLKFTSTWRVSARAAPAVIKRACARRKKKNYCYIGTGSASINILWRGGRTNPRVDPTRRNAFVRAPPLGLATTGDDNLRNNEFERGAFWLFSPFCDTRFTSDEGAAVSTLFSYSRANYVSTDTRRRGRRCAHGGLNLRQLFTVRM